MSFIIMNDIMLPVHNRSMCSHFDAVHRLHVLNKKALFPSNILFFPLFFKQKKNHISKEYLHFVTEHKKKAAAFQPSAKNTSKIVN